MSTPLIQQPAISVVTVCLNAGKTIRDTIESVLGQCVPHVEYIVVDGGSTDGTLDILHSYGEQISWTSERDNGIADAFNRGITRCRGAIVAIVNADDVLCPNALAVVSEYFLLHQDVGVVHGDINLFAHGKFVRRVAPASHIWSPLRLILFNHPATFVRKTVYDTYGLYDIGFKIAMDVEMFIRWQRAGVWIDYLPIPLVNMNTGGASNQAGSLGCREVRAAFLRHGYPMLLVTIQFVCRMVLVRIALILLWFRRIQAGQKRK